MNDPLDFKRSALTIMADYFSDIRLTDYQKVSSYSEARQNLIKLAELCHILVNLSHYYQIIPVELLAREVLKTKTLCLTKKLKHCYDNSKMINEVFAYLEKLINSIDDRFDPAQIPEETKNFIRKIQSIQNTGESEPPEINYSFEYHIQVRPSESVFSTGLDLIGVLDELRKLGKATIVPLLDKVPDLESINPEKCYLGWSILLLSDADLNAVKDILVFLEYDQGCILSYEEKKLRTSGPEPSPQTIPDFSGPVELKIEEKMPSSPQPQPAKTPRSEAPALQKDDSLSTIRVPASKLDSVVDLVGEMVTVQSRLTRISSKMNAADLSSVSEELERLTNELRVQSMSLRMLPASVLFKRFNRLVRDLSQEIGKNIELSFEGEETELDKTVIEKLQDPLVHLVRNSIDHGIESPQERSKLGKPEAGHITLAAFQSGPEVLVQIKDDGSGIHLDKVRKKALEKGLVKETDSLTEKQITQLIFLPGFSTAENVSNLSGRGVGMDVVKSNIESLRGSVDILTQEGLGTTITLKLPLTLAIIDGLLVEVGNELFVLPLSSVEECLEFQENLIENKSSRKIINLRGEAVPFLSLEQLFGMEQANSAVRNIVVIQDENEGRVGLVVNAIVGQHQTVIKPLGSLHKEREEFSGATILGDGSVALILDTSRLVKAALQETAKD